ELHIVAEHDMRANHAERADGDARADLGTAFDDRRCMDRGRDRHSTTSMALPSASATMTPLTFASPRYHHMVRRWLSFFMWYSTMSPGCTGFRDFVLSMVMKKTSFRPGFLARVGG